MPRSRHRPDAPSGRAAREWVGGRLRSPFYITGAEPPYRPDIILWVELPGEVPVAAAIQDPDAAPLSLARTLLDAFAKPVAGPPRRPQRIRVADAGDAAEVRAAAGPGIEVVVAPTPELATVMEAMAADLGGEAVASYFEDGRIGPELVADLFAAAHVLHAAAPWKHANDQHTLRMDIPALGVEGACVSIIGALEQTRGLIVFPSYTALEVFVEAAEAGVRGETRADLGTTMLSLTLEGADELPPSMRREALEHGWPVAGPDAYPRVEHRDHHGMPRPLTERDLCIATACAYAVASFAVTHGHVFSADSFEPASVTFTGDDEVAVRLTMPYEAADLFEPHPQLALSLGEEACRQPGRRRPSRNAPCWCGSGRKYKRCHYAADQAAEGARATRRAPIHTVDERLVRRMARFATARFGEDWLDDAARHFADAEAAIQLFLPWAVYHLPVNGRRVVDWFLAVEGRRLSPEERSWLQAQRSGWLGVWEVLEVAPGSGLEVRDLLTGAERRVAEVSGSRTLVARDAVLGRVVDHGSLSLFAGVHPRPLPPEDGAAVVRAVRGRVRRRRDIPVERLREPAVERYLVARWEESVAAMDARHSVPPVLCNTDGDELLFTTDHFAFDAAVRDELAAALASVEELEGPDAEDGDDVYTFMRPAGAAGALPGGTVLGRVRLAAAGLALETNSLARADRLRERLEAACGDLLTHGAREHTSPPALAQAAGEPVEAPEPPPPEVQQALEEWLEEYYDAWLDQPVPALSGMTPRQAARTRAGREQVNVLLKEMENRAARLPGGGTPDVARLRAKLGMED